MRNRCCCIVVVQEEYGTKGISKDTIQLVGPSGSFFSFSGYWSRFRLLVDAIQDCVALTVTSRHPLVCSNKVATVSLSRFLEQVRRTINVVMI